MFRKRSIFSKHMKVKTNTFYCNRFCVIRENEFYIRNVGFSSGNHLLGEAYINKNAWSGYLSCNGTEADIMQCEKPSSFRFVPYVRSETDIGTWLYCFDFNITSMRLVNGLNSNEGVVELQIGGRWGSILMPDHIDTSEFETGVCQFLGYVDDSKILDSFVTDYLKHTWRTNFVCYSFTDCIFTTDGFRYPKLTVKCKGMFSQQV
ncbi:uncharacterized protein LOC132733894 [Ruditapes philippinarum]|uniref:uncharacterized protein LOC132733894 n=1 Tax=Ruditapes philippinarum TaxID=129788 RepID=UPI00295BC53C|nr:uncharacterized protein LOC132733894 [Ruditapes philippinarum]